MVALARFRGIDRAGWRVLDKRCAFGFENLRLCLGLGVLVSLSVAAENNAMWTIVFKEQTGLESSRSSYRGWLAIEARQVR